MSEDERADFRKQNLGFVFQNFNLLDMLTIQENIYIPLLLTKKSGNRCDEKDGKDYGNSQYKYVDKHKKE